MSFFQSLLTDSGAAVHTPQTLGINMQIGVVLWGQSNALGFPTPDVPSTSPVNYQLPIVGTSILINGTTNFNTLLYAINAQGDTFNSNLSMAYDLYQAIGRPVYFGMKAEN